jgi:hypothetical protein
LLGHRGRDITVKHYLDQSKLNIDGIELPSVLNSASDVVADVNTMIERAKCTPEELLLLAAYRSATASKRRKAIESLL